MIHLLEHALEDTLPLLPVLFLTYLLMETLEKKGKGKAERAVRKAGKWGPLLGGLLGAAPQCGFSAAASNLYAGRVISLGTLLAIYLSTSDEMLPILISERAETGRILALLAMKAGIGILAGLIIDLLLRKKEEPFHIHEMCEKEHCRCEDGIFRSALRHTAEIGFFVFLVTFFLNVALHYVGEETFSSFFLHQPVLGPLVSALIGMIPNCAASVVITQLYLDGAMSLGTMLAGLLAGAGTGVLVLFRVNRNARENLQIAALLYAIGAAAGMVTELLGAVWR